MVQRKRRSRSRQKKRRRLRERALQALVDRAEDLITRPVMWDDLTSVEQADVMATAFREEMSKPGLARRVLLVSVL
jgi:hypothetical protein